ncbi:MAG: ATPase [Alphaproteobacteria bacterium]
MKISGREFLDQERKAVTLMGMSGVGKTYLACQLKGWGWDFYSCDYEIGTKHLNIPVTPEDLSLLSGYIGKLGNPAMGGMGLAEFKKRQKAYYDAECAAVEAIGGSKKNFVNDSTGSLCEIMDEGVIRRLGAKTLIVYIQSDEAHNRTVIERARLYPKPLFFPPAKFDEWLAEYLGAKGLSGADDIVPDEFSRWVFPRLLESRLPKYQKIADTYGVTIPAADLKDVKSERDFVDVVAAALG